MAKAQKSTIRLSGDDRLYYFINDAILLIALLVVAYPLIYVFAAAFSDKNAVVTGKVVLWPVDFSLEGFKTVFGYKAIMTGYMNTIIYAVVGTLVNVTMTLLAAYPLTRKDDMPGRNLIMYLFTFTMIFGGGLIPTYILMQNLDLIDKRAVLIIPNAMGVFHLIIARTFLTQSIPNELYEAATIDGCSHFKYMLKIILPLSKPLLAVLVLFYAVGHWNAFFDAFIYLKNPNLFPLQLILRDILIANSIDPTTLVDPETMEKKLGMAELLKYAVIVVASVPVWCLYPFIQQYFVKGVMIGAVKG
ncbi:MAG: carbohydrate ABC transporter permease [Clostridiaceae bacterium]|jgi:multiple sugar transport system permease protein/putative aldouronate transport system permease protein|nr:carbohydrate ABC transporter permease [Clostridiaceae bacterium]